MSTHKDTAFAQPRGWVVFGVISSVYFLVYFHRVAISVIAPDLLEAFQASATALGFISSMYFYLYALEQPMVGFLTDRLGPRRVVGWWTLAAALGSFLFAFAPSIGWAAAGRGLVGFGVGGVYVPAMKAFSQWFGRRAFSTVMGLLLAVGNLGAVVATTPLAWMSASLGWRASFAIVGAVTLCLTFATFAFVGEKERAAEPALEHMITGGTGSGRGSALRVMKSLRFWVLAASFIGFFGGFQTFQGLWATPYLMSAYRLSQMQASEVNMLLPIGFMIGAPVFGWLSERVFRDRANVLSLFLVIHAAVWLCLTIPGADIGIGGMSFLFLVMGLAAGGFATALWSLVRDTTPLDQMGLTTGLLNPAPFVGVAVFQVWTGAVLDHVGRVGGSYPPEAFRRAFLVCFLSQVICLVLCLVFRRNLRGRG